MLSSSLAFILWGFPGPLLKYFHANAVLMSFLRYLFAGSFLYVLGRTIFRKHPQLSRPISWSNPYLWLSSANILARNIFYMMSIVSGPTVVGGLIYGYVPLVIPLLSYFLGLESQTRINRVQLLGIFICFLGNYLIFKGIDHGNLGQLTGTVIFAMAAAGCYAATPLFAVKLLGSGMKQWSLLRAQCVQMALFAIPFILLSSLLGGFKGASSEQLRVTVWLALGVSVFFTILPFSLLYLGIQRAGAANTAILGFLEPLTTTFLSFFIFHDSHPTPIAMAGILCLIVGVVIYSVVKTPKVKATEAVSPKWMAGLPVHRFTSVLVFHLLALPALYPVATVILFGCDWSVVADYYLSPVFTVLNLFGILILWNSWQYRKWARYLIPLHSVALFTQSLLFILKLPGPHHAWHEALAAVLSAVTAFPSLILFWRLRRDRRIPANFSAGLQLVGAGPGLVQARVVDLSNSGARLLVNQPLGKIAVGQTVELIIQGGEGDGKNTGKSSGKTRGVAPIARKSQIVRIISNSTNSANSTGSANSESSVGSADLANSSHSRSNQESRQTVGGSMEVAVRFLPNPENEKKPILGILGGLGPITSAHFLQSIYREAAGTSKEQDMPRVILFSDPTFPDRTTAFLKGETQEVLQKTEEQLKRLLAAGADHMVMACFTLHHILPRISIELAEKVISLPQLALQELEQSGKSGLLLCTTGSRKLGVFANDPFFSRVSKQVVFPNDKDQEEVHRIIYSLKTHLDPEQALGRLTDLARKYKVDQWISGCTEFHLISAQRKNIIDPLRTLAKNAHNLEKLKKVDRKAA